jgi:hypothetical protein
MHLTHEYVRSLYARYYYSFLTRPYELNLFGIRSKKLLVNEFDDVLGIAWEDFYGMGQCLAFRGTTDPGLYWLKNKLGNINGTFILAPGFYEECFELGYHRGSYRAFVQAAPGIFRGWRDDDSDGHFDMSGLPTYTDVTGLNLHHANDAEYVGPTSAACQVVQSDREQQVMVALGERHAELHKNLFNYALFQAQ